MGEGHGQPSLDVDWLTQPSPAPLTLSPLGWLHDTPRPLWILATLIMPLTGLAWLTRMGHAPSGPGQAKVGPTSVSERVRRRQSTPV